MRRARFTTIGATTATLACLWSGFAAARASTPECRAVRVTVRGRVTATWQRAVNALDAAMRALPPDECKPFDLIVEASPGAEGGLSVTARTRDGRSGGRHVERPDSLATVALGLIAALPEDDTSATVDSAKVADAPATPAPATDATAKAIAPEDLPPRDAPAPPKRDVALAAHPSRLSAEAGAGVRLALPTQLALPDFVARLDLAFTPWFGTAALRIAPMGVSLREGHETFDYVEVGVGLGAGRRVALTSVCLDLSLMVAMTVVAQEGNPPNDAIAGVRPQLRMSPALRVLFFPRARFHPAFTIDAEVAPSGLASARYIDERLDPLPSFTVGARIAVVGDVM